MALADGPMWKYDFKHTPTCTHTRGNVCGHIHTEAPSLCKSYKTVTFLCRTPPSPPLHSSSPPSAPIQLRPDGRACLSYRPLPAVVRIWDLGVSPSLSSPHAKKTGGQWFGMLHTHTHTHTHTHKQLQHTCQHTKTHKHWRTSSGRTLTHIHAAHPDFIAASCVDVSGKIIILKRKYCLAPFRWLSPLFSVIRCSAGLCNATCLWLLMTTATLYSPILLTRSSTLMNHLYSVHVCASLCRCIFTCLCVCVCVRYLNCWRVAPFVYEPIIFTYFSPNDYFETSTEEVEQR